MREGKLVLTIRHEQMSVFSTAALERFVVKMVNHHQRVFAAWSRDLGAKALNEFVRHGIRRAQSYGFDTELDVARYLHVMQALGKDFDEAPDFPWAAPLLKKKLPPGTKMNRLRDAAQYELAARRIRSANGY